MVFREKKKKISFFWRKTLLVFLCVSFFLSAVPARAGYWGEPTIANLMLYNMEQIADRIKGMTLSIVKNVALRTINEKVLSLVNGRSGKGSLIISNWRDFIFTQSNKAAKDVVLNNFFPNLFSGKGSGGNYTPSEAVNNTAASIQTIRNYPQYLSTIGKNTLNEITSNAIKYTLDQVCPNPSASLSRGDYACFSALMQPQNNPYGIPILTQQAYAAEQQKNQLVAQTQAGISGYKPQTNSKGLVVTPPRTIADIVATVQSLPAQALALAQNPSELITGVIQIYINSLVQKVLSKVGMNPSDAAIVGNTASDIVGDTSDNIQDYFSGSSGDIGPNNVGSPSENPWGTSAGGGMTWRPVGGSNFNDKSIIGTR